MYQICTIAVPVAVMFGALKTKMIYCPIDGMNTYFVNISIIFKTVYMRR